MSASNPVDKGACNFVKNEIQTWLPCTIINNFLNFLIKILCGGGACLNTSCFCCDKAKLWNEVQWHNGGIVAQA